MAPDSTKSGHQTSKMKKSPPSKESEEYRKRRARNNIAVRKSRTKTKLRTIDTLKRVNELKAENENLEVKVKLLSKELSLLKDLFLAHAGHMPDTTGSDTNCANDGTSCCALTNRSLKDHGYAADSSIKAEA